MFIRAKKSLFGSKHQILTRSEAESQLIVIEPLGPPAKLAALQLLDDEVEPFDLGVRFAEAGALGGERARRPLQRLHIVGQGARSMFMRKGLR